VPSPVALCRSDCELAPPPAPAGGAPQ
jgi:hypothetical protein